MKDDFRQRASKSYSLSDLLKGNDLEIVVASLLVLGKLKVESVQLYRAEPVVGVTLLGEFKSADKHKENKLADILEENEDLTFDEVIAGIRRQMNRN